jgi:hypothetical protein
MSESNFDDMVKKVDKKKYRCAKIDNIFDYFYEFDDNEIDIESKRKLKIFTFTKVNIFIIFCDIKILFYYSH